MLEVKTKISESITHARGVQATDKTQDLAIVVKDTFALLELGPVAEPEKAAFIMISFDHERRVWDIDVVNNTTGETIDLSLRGSDDARQRITLRPVT